MPKLNFQGLLKMAAVSEEFGVHMNFWVTGQEELPEGRTEKGHPCGTIGCLAGNYALASPHIIKKAKDQLQTKKSNRLAANYACETGAVEQDLGLNAKQANWLFYGQMISNTNLMGESLPFAKEIQHDLDEMTTEVAVRRLRKFIYFKLKQKEIHDAWNERQHTRHAQSENTGFIAQSDSEHLSDTCEQLAEAVAC